MSSLQKALAKENIGGKKNRNPPTVTTAVDESESSSEEDDSSVESNEEDQPNSEDMIKIREQALKVLNTPSSGPQAEAQKKKYGQQTFESPYQQKQSPGEKTFVQVSSTPSNLYSSYQTSNQYSMHDPLAHLPAQTAEKLTVTDMFVNCVSEVCKSSSSEILHKVLGAGYRSMSNYENPPVSGTWGDIDTSQHGYGNGNKPPTQYSGNMNGGGKIQSSYHD